MYSKKEAKSLKMIYDWLKRSKNPVVAFSGGKDSLVLLNLVMRVVRKNRLGEPTFLVGDPVPFIETNMYISEVLMSYGIRKYVWWTDILKTDHIVGAGEIAKDKIRCCYNLKVRPLLDFIRENKVDVLMTAIRADEHVERSKEKEVRFYRDPEHFRVHPLLHWTWTDVLSYVKDNNLKLNPLYFKGYTSLGCRPCTRPVTDGFSSIDELIEFSARSKMERAGRDIDKELVMDRLRSLGYF